MSKIIGIDLGTTNSAVSVYDPLTKNWKILENQEGERTTPSIIAYKDGKVMVGKNAKNQAVTNAKNTVYAVKRLIGRTIDDPEVQKMMKTAPYKIVKADNTEAAWVEIDGQKKSPEEISAEILKKLKAAAETKLGEPVTEAVITVPAYFNDAQRKATKDAGRIAGLDVKRIVNEPTAAALAFGLNTQKDQNIIVYDLGGGTFDVSVLEIMDLDGETSFEVMAANGDTFLGGEDFDRAIIDHILSSYKDQSGVDLTVSDDAKGYGDAAREAAMQRIKQAAEEAKKELSSMESASINIPYIAVFDGQPQNIMMDMSRAELEGLVKGLIERSKEPCLKALADAGLSMSDINEVVMVGGMTRMPAVKEFVKGVFGKEPNCSVNPDEVVAAGASVQGGVLSGEVGNIALMDVIPLSLAVRINGGEAERVVEKQSTIPCSITHPHTFSTSQDGQKSVRIRLFQGESKSCDDPSMQELGELQMEVPPAKAGEIEIEVTVNINADGLITLTAQDNKTKRPFTAEIKTPGGLSEEEIAKRVQMAEATREKVEAEIANANAAASAEAVLKEAEETKEKDWYKDATEEARTAFNTAAENLKTAVESNDNSNMAKLMEDFRNAEMGLTQSTLPETTEANDDAPSDENSTEDAPKKAPSPNKPGM